MGKNVNNESVDVKGFKGGSTNNDSWTDILAESTASIFEVSVKEETKKDEATKREYTTITPTLTLKDDVNSLSALKDGFANFMELINAMTADANDLAKAKFMELIKLEADYENRMRVSENLTLDIRKNQLTKAYTGREEITDDNGRKVTLFKYKVDAENATFGTISTVWANSEIAARYAAKLAKAEAERLKAEREAAARKAAEEQKDKQIADMLKTQQRLLAKLAELGVTL